MRQSAASFERCWTALRLATRPRSCFTFVTVPLLFGVPDSQSPNLGTFELRIVGENSEADPKADRYSIHHCTTNRDLLLL